MAKTFRFDNSNSAMTISGGAFSHRMQDTAVGSDSITAASGSGTSTAYYISDSAYNLAGVSNTGTWTLVLNVSVAAASTDVTCRVARYNSSAVQQAAVQIGTANTSTASTGDKTFQVTNPALGTWASGDRLVVEVVVRNTASHGGAAGPTFDFTATNNRLDTPFTLANNYTQPLTASVSFTSAATRRVGKALAGALSFTGAVARSVSRTLTGATLSMTSAMTRSTSRGHTADITFTVSFTPAYQAAAAPALVIIHYHVE